MLCKVHYKCYLALYCFLMILANCSPANTTLNLEWIRRQQQEPTTQFNNGQENGTATALPDFTTLVRSIAPMNVKTLLDTLGWKIAIAIQVYWLPVIIPLGWTGNILSLAVQLQAKNRVISCCIYMAGLAVCDCGMLAIATQYWARTIQVLYFMDTDLSKIVLPDIDCKVMNWLFHVFSLTGVCITLSMTVDRFIGVCFPFQAKSLCTVSRAKKILLCTPVLTASYTVPYLLYSKQVGPSCVALAVSNTFTKIYSWVTICLNSFIPFLAIITMNSAIIKTILFRHKNFTIKESLPQTGNITEDEAKSKPRKEKIKTRESQLVLQLLLISFTFLALTLPLYCRFIFYLYVDSNTSLESAATFQLVYHITNKLFYTNSSVNFILYCIAGSKFRKDVCKLFSCCKQQTKKDQATPTQKCSCSSSKEQSSL